MGKHGKKHKEAATSKPRRLRQEAAGGDELPSSAYDLPPPDSQEEEEEEVEQEEEEEEANGDSLSKFHLYQKSVQSPKGDISYLQKFFLTYVGGRFPLHLQEDFCGTALLSSEWLRSDSRRTAVGLDLDFEALNWCLENNLTKVGTDGYSRIHLYHGNVLQPQEARLVKSTLHDSMRTVDLDDQDDSSEPVEHCTSRVPSTMEEAVLPSRDIICAFNYSCCCLQRRADLLLYFKHVLRTLSRKGGIFVMDLYGGTSSERKLRLQRRFSNFTYFWEQAEFDIISRRTRISLHFHLGRKKILHAFSYDWRLWSLPEIKDCLEEAGFQSVHFWIREMPNTQESRNSEEYNGSRDVKYEEMSSFEQLDAWNAYVVGVANV
ncbi:uncharacterized protein M6B38_416395 [Iris pallida]|uniref:S-adenosyl-L-methionine-dependent methyltransferase superfamily protein n=1 Tax=Iris pallida TaxID=29817 RepID=A0AAX6FK22_IRIPA|nr:uncharacterized protein M6B38_416395 [Iris pallida]